MSLPDNVSDPSLKIPGTDCSNNDSWNPFGSFANITHKNCLVGVNWGLLSRLSSKTLTSSFELLVLSALNLIIGCLFISNSKGDFPNVVGVAL